MRLQHPQAITVTLLLCAERTDRAFKGLEEAAHDVLARYFEDWCDEQKADLYALMAEKVHGNMTIGQMQAAVSDCLWDNQNEWLNRYG